MRAAYWFLPLAAFAILPMPASAQENYQVGVGRADITPVGPIWMSGYAGRKKPSEGVDLPLSAKALVVQQGKDVPLVLITADIIGFPHAVAEAIAGQVAKEAQVPRERIMLVASHTHTGPVIASGLTGMYELTRGVAG